MKSDSYRPSVVIVGANFGGLTAATRLPKSFHVTVVDPAPYFEFLPNIHELVSGLKTPEQLRFSKEKIVTRAGHRFIQEAVTKMLPAQKRLLTHSGTWLPYDYCILSFGGQDNTAIVKGAEKHALPFKSIRQCHAIFQRLEDLSKRKKKISIVIAGGGFEGVEALGEILRKYRNTRGIHIHVVEKQDRLMADAPTDIDGEIRRLCADFPVTFHTGAAITRIWKHSIDLYGMSGKHKIPSHLTIWTGGAVPPAILYESNLTRGPNQWLNVDQTLQHSVYPNIFAAGDIAGLPDPLQKQAYHALDMGKTAAENIVRLHKGKPPAPFKSSAKPMLVAFGDMDVFLIDKRMVVAGPSLGLLKEAVFQYVMTMLDPSGAVFKAVHASTRVTESAFTIISTYPVSFSSLTALGKIRIIK